LTWRPPIGLPALIRRQEQSNVLEPVKELRKKSMGMIVNTGAISENLKG